MGTKFSADTKAQPKEGDSGDEHVGERGHPQLGSTGYESPDDPPKPDEELAWTERSCGRAEDSTADNQARQRLDGALHADSQAILPEGPQTSAKFNRPSLSESALPRVKQPQVSKHQHTSPYIDMHRHT